jgi:hypothetical protein
VSDGKTPAGHATSWRAVAVTAATVAVLASAAGYLVGRSGGGGSPLDGRPSGGAVLARFQGEAVTAAEIDALSGPKDSPLRAQLKDPAARKEFLEGWTRTLLLARRAEAEGFHRTQEFARSYAQELSTAFVEKKLEESAAGRALTDDEVRAWFAEHEKELQRPERARLAIITFDAPDAATRARKLAAAQGALAAAQQRPLDALAFGNLARLRSEDARTRAFNGELPPMSREELTSTYGPELAAAAFELTEPGAILPRVVETPSALHVVKLVVREGEQKPTFDDVKEVLRQRLTSERRSRARREIVGAAVRDAGMKVDEKAIAGM